MNAQRGFTLIELVVVIIVLGILAVTAAPKFIDLQTDARKATLQGAKGALQGANALIYSKAAINGDEKCGSSCTAIDLPGTSQNVNPVYGSIPATVVEVQEAAGLETADWTVVEADVGSGQNAVSTIFITPSGTTAVTSGDKAAACQLEYVPATSSDSATYTIQDGGC